MTESITVLFRATTPEGAASLATAWARDEGMRVRTVARIKRREDMPAQSADDDPTVSLWPFEVTLSVVAP